MSSQENNLFIELDGHMYVSERNGDEIIERHQISDEAVVATIMAAIKEATETILGEHQMCKNIVVVEAWSNSMITITPDGKSRDVSLAHIANSIERAKEWCACNENYAGNEHEWHWAVTETQVDGDYLCDYPHHFTRDLEECNEDGVVEEKDDEDDLIDLDDEDESSDNLVLEGKLDIMNDKIEELSEMILVLSKRLDTRR